MNPLQSKIKEMLREYAELNELFTTSHYSKSIMNRLKEVISYKIVMSTPDRGKLRHEVVGSYELTEVEKLMILDNVNTIESVDMPTDGEYGVKVYEYELSHSDLDMYSFDIDKRLHIMKSTVQGNSSLYIQDPVTESTGDVLFMIVENQSIKTILHARSFNLEDKYNHLENIYGMDEIWMLKD